MKIITILILSIVLLGSVQKAESQSDTVKCKTTNFVVSGGVFSFDLYILRSTPGDFVMGNSSFYFNYTPGSMGTPFLTNINPKYSNNASYQPLLVVGLPPAVGIVGVQVLHRTGTSGENITNIPGPTGFGERLATVNLNVIVPTTTAGLSWNRLESGIVSPTFSAAYGDYDGTYNGPLPVELASFTSSISRNNVTLNWSTTTETNNSGFDVERKSAIEGSEWTKVGFIEGNGTTTEIRSYTFNDKNLAAGHYTYRLKQIDYNGNFEYFTLQNEIEIGVPLQFELSQNYPNPFNPSTKINFALPADGNVSLTLFDISGRLVTTLINNEFRTANYYTVDFNAANLSSGTYFYTIKAGNNIETKKMLLVK